MKQIIYLVIGFTLLITLVASFNELMFLKTTKTCGYFFKITTSRYVDYYHYSYMKNDKKLTGSIMKKELKVKTFEKLKRMGCVKIEYSNYSDSYSRVIDIRLVTV